MLETTVDILVVTIRQATPLLMITLGEIAY